MYELPEQPSADDVAAVSHDWSTLNAEMDAEWYKHSDQLDAISDLKPFSGHSPPPSDG
jgi:hypothetical protein